ncbi:hypothetical protein BHE90_015009 [Fusarium euwallaceae]|uniref:Uncharacterized protein n=1 Tax=Fusarium euwallaceae TaxID=1147111 RepID=A0A430L4D5_9HYPO|nr:hypothetical protein BHE90_015009 [Fusarium euwallaceae]
MALSQRLAATLGTEAASKTSFTPTAAQTKAAYQFDGPNEAQTSLAQPVLQDWDIENWCLLDSSSSTRASRLRTTHISLLSTWTIRCPNLRILFLV